MKTTFENLTELVYCGENYIENYEFIMVFYTTWNNEHLTSSLN